MNGPTHSKYWFSQATVSLSDSVLDSFINDCIIQCPHGSCNEVYVYDKFKDWYIRIYGKQRPPGLKVVVDYINKLYTKSEGRWLGIKIYEQEDFMENCIEAPVQFHQYAYKQPVKSIIQSIPVEKAQKSIIQYAYKQPDVKSIQAIPVEKAKKKAIPKKVKTDVWNTYVGADINAHRCLCCKKTRIQITDFQVGHVQSEKEGGTLEIGNLRPICSACNASMGSHNMIDFVKKYGYYIG